MLITSSSLIIKNIGERPETEVFLGSNLDFTISDFTWGLANDDNICKKKRSAQFD